MFCLIFNMALTEEVLNQQFKVLHNYYTESLVLLNVCSNNYHEARSKIALKEWIIPKKPKFDIEDFLQLKNKKVKSVLQSGCDLHSYLKKLLIYDIQRQPIRYPQITDFDNLLKCLIELKTEMQLDKLESFKNAAMFGYYMEMFYFEFKKQEIKINWQEYIKFNFKISDTWCRQLRCIGRTCRDFPRLQHLSIRVSEFIKRKDQIMDLLYNEQFKEEQIFWKSLPSTHVL